MSWPKTWGAGESQSTPYPQAPSTHLSSAKGRASMSLTRSRNKAHPDASVSQKISHPLSRSWRARQGIGSMARISGQMEGLWSEECRCIENEREGALGLSNRSMNFIKICTFTTIYSLSLSISYPLASSPDTLDTLVVDYYHALSTMSLRKPDSK